jgi:hypothetical protein
VAHRQQPAGAGERVPLFAVRRAMPPAPSLKRPAPAPASAPAEPLVEKLQIDSLEITAPLLETLIAEHPGTEAAKAAAQALSTQRVSSDPAPQAELPSAAPMVAPAPELETPMAVRESRAAAAPEDPAQAPTALRMDPPEHETRDENNEGDAPTDTERLVQEPDDASGRETSEELAAAAGPASEPFGQEPIEAPDVAPAADPGERATPIEEPEVTPDRAETHDAGSRGEALVARWEDSVAAVSARARIRQDRDEETLVARHDEDIVPAAPTVAEADRDEHPLTARRERAIERTTSPTKGSDRDAPVAQRRAPPAPATPVMEKAAARNHESELPDIEMPQLDAVAMEMRAAEIAMVAKAATSESQEREDPHLDMPPMHEPESTAPSAERPAAKMSDSEIAVPADLAQKASGAPIRERGNGLPRMETRIERRRIDALRADPWIAGRRPVFPHIDLEVWDVPPPDVAARARRRHSGTGWAIGLGALLLIAGITAPAALWQDRQRTPGDQDQVVALTPTVVAPQPEPQATPPSPSQAASQETQQQATAEPPAPAVQAPSVETPSAPPSPPASTGTASSQPANGAPAPDETTALSEIRNRSELNPAPVNTPPAPKIPAAVAPSPTLGQIVDQTLASRPAAPDPMVPHPFVPEGAPKPTPFRPEQTAGQPAGAAFGAAAGAAAVADIGAPAETAPVTGGPATIALKPSLSGQLKPTQTATADSTVRPVRQTVTRKPRPFYPQSLDQMFQNLVDTLGQGNPANPATKPLPPSNRR